MKNVNPGRYSSEMDGSFVVFIIGMRINRLMAIHKWLPVVRTMGPMIRELYEKPDLGFISHEMMLSARGTTMIQYWRSYEQLEQYARQGHHLQAWQNFNRSVAANGSVGIFHETYVISPGQYECIYTNMPPVLLGRAGRYLPVHGARETSRQRMEGNIDTGSVINGGE
ncbi:DUF4188 domain-containing protein [Paenibacillus herberti]|uniref:Transcriptional regulator n=1 Tax=Paenibacillus herberti TaxID=1619309 RepID=A0A229NTL6_9BACL|nr:DUF4188 domain-containing protein [Paenibacillus herberti]OXM13230.1 transcriptional regulator [Paenibacillus herberti]